MSQPAFSPSEVDWLLFKSGILALDVASDQIERSREMPTGSEALPVWIF